MTRIKFSHLTDLLCEGDSPKYFMTMVTMPPLLKQTQKFILKRAAEDQIIGCYQSEFLRITKEGKEVDESLLKRRMMQIPLPTLCIPPILEYLRQKKMSFPELLCTLAGDDLIKQQIKKDVSVAEIVEKAVCLLGQQK